MVGKRLCCACCVVCALIARALIRLDRENHGKSRDFLMFQAINMRSRTVPHAVHSCIPSWGDWNSRTGRSNALGNIAKEIFTPDTNNLNLLIAVSLAFYEADFGRGKPVWKSIGPLRPSVNMVVRAHE